MISARLVGDDIVLGWLRAIPDAVSSGLGRAITTLGIDLQRRVQEKQATERVRGSLVGSSQPNLDLQIEIGGDQIAARVVSNSDEAAARINVKASLDHIKQASSPAISKRLIARRSRPMRTELSKQSFLRSALEDMDPEIRENVDAALREGLTSR